MPGDKIGREEFYSTAISRMAEIATRLVSGGANLVYTGAAYKVIPFISITNSFLWRFNARPSELRRPKCASIWNSHIDIEKNR